MACEGTAAHGVHGICSPTQLDWVASQPFGVIYLSRVCLSTPFKRLFLRDPPSAQHLRGHPSAADPTGAMPGPTLGTLPLVTHLLSGKEPLGSSRDCKCLPGIYRGAMSVGKSHVIPKHYRWGVPERVCPGTCLNAGSFPCYGPGIRLDPLFAFGELSVRRASETARRRRSSCMAGRQTCVWGPPPCQ